jgi:hypothetical protein
MSDSNSAVDVSLVLGDQNRRPDVLAVNFQLTWPGAGAKWNELSFLARQLRLKLVAVVNNAVKSVVGDMSDLNPFALNVRRTAKSNIASEPGFHNLYQ